MTVRPKKNVKKPRLIAIPKCLSVWIQQQEKWYEMNQNTIQHRMIQLQKMHPSLHKLSMETFRKNFSSIMELAGVDHEIIDAHQGRYQNSVLKQHYLKDKMRAVRLMRPHIDRVFGSKLVTVKIVPTCDEPVTKPILGGQKATDES